MRYYTRLAVTSLTYNIYMIVNAVSDYLPELIISNDFFVEKAGLSRLEMFSKSGINQRRHCRPGENTNTMAIGAVNKILCDLPFPITEIDLIIGATYTPYDNIATAAHAVQKHFAIEKAKCFTVGSSCSSFVNALETVECYLAGKKASKALIVISEHNSAYYNPSDPKSGFLWGDGAAAVVITNQRYSERDFQVMDLNTTGLGHIGRSNEGVSLKPCNGGLMMLYGKDVFQQACTYMIRETEQILKRNGIALNELSWFIPHQANARITQNIGKRMNLDPSRILANIELYGNTGSASTPIVLSQNLDRFKPDDTIVISVFGGGYSSGAVLLKKL